MAGGSMPQRNYFCGNGSSAKFSDLRGFPAKVARASRLPLLGHATVSLKRQSVFRLASEGACGLIMTSVQRQQKNSGVRRIAKSAIAGLLLVSWLFTTAMAVSPALHKYFHHDAGSPDHQCAVTLFTHGQLMTEDTAPVLAIFVLLMLFYVPLVKLAEFSSIDLRLGFGRAPPHFFSLR
jgi:hypothetical protein